MAEHNTLLMAYTGAGADLGFVAYALMFLSWLLTCIGAVVLWPLRARRRRMRAGKDTPAPPAGADATPPLQ